MHFLSISGFLLIEPVLIILYLNTIDLTVLVTKNKLVFSGVIQIKPARTGINLIFSAFLSIRSSCFLRC